MRGVGEEGEQHLADEEQQRRKEWELKQDQEVFSGVALESAGFVDGTTELLLKHAVVVTKFLFLIQANAVVTESLVLHAVQTGRGQLAFGGVLWDICDRNAEPTGEANFGTGVASHGLLLGLGTS